VPFQDLAVLTEFNDEARLLSFRNKIDFLDQTRF
jgi:hypothetical protein